MSLKVQLYGFCTDGFNCVFFVKKSLVYSQHAYVNKRLKQLKQRPELFDLFVERKCKRVR